MSEFIHWLAFFAQLFVSIGIFIYVNLLFHLYAFICLFVILDLFNSLFIMYSFSLFMSAFNFLFVCITGIVTCGHVM